MDDSNECANFIQSDSNSVLTATSSNAFNTDGYSVLNNYTLANMKEVGLNTTAHYNFEEGSPSLTCRYFSTSTPCSFDQGIVAASIVNSPEGAPTDYPAEGGSYLRVMGTQRISPHSSNSPISVQKNTDYYVNYLVNTKGSGVNAKVWIYNATSSLLNTSPIAIV